MTLRLPPSKAVSFETVEPASKPFIRFVSTKEMEDAAQNRREALQTQNSPPITNLAKMVLNQFERNKRHKLTENIDEELLDNLRQRKGEYDKATKTLIEQQGGQDVYMRLTSVKSLAAESWIKDVMGAAGKNSVQLASTPIAELPRPVQQQVADKAAMEFLQQRQPDAMPIGPEEMQSIFERAIELKDETMRLMQMEAEERAERMEVQVFDDLEQVGFEKVFNDFIADVTTFKNAFIKGPIVRKRKQKKYVQKDDGSYKVDVKLQIVEEYERVSPFDIYPSPDATCINDGNLIQRVRYNRRQLNNMKQESGYDKNSIDYVLELYGKDGFSYPDHIADTRADLENLQGPDEGGAIYDNMIEGLIFYGPLPASQLIEWGVKEAFDLDPHEEVETIAYVVGNYLVKVSLNDDPLDARPFYTTSFEKVPGSFWGLGIPDKMKDIQAICNSAARELMNNMGIAAGPQIAINDINRIPAEEQVTNIYPRKVWQFKPSLDGTTGLPLSVFDIPSHAAELMAVYQAFAKMADDHTGVPAFTHGNLNVPGAARTSSGLSMLMSSAAKGIKTIIAQIDEDVIQPIVQNRVDRNMLYNPDNTIKGDVKVRPRGILAAIMQEQMAVRRMEVLNTTNNPVDMQILGLTGRAKLLRDTFDSVDIPVEGLIPSEEEIEQKEQAMQVAQLQAQASSEGQAA